MPAACAISSIALSSAMAAACLSGARAHEDWGSRVQPYRVGGRCDGRAGVEAYGLIWPEGSKEIVEAARGPCAHGGGSPVSRAPGGRRPGRRRPGASAARWPTGPYICSRRSTSFTGRPTRRAARMPRTCGPEIMPLDPNPPAQKTDCGLECFSGGISNSPADPRFAPQARPWLGVSTERRSPSPGEPRLGVRLHCIVVLGLVSLVDRPRSGVPLLPARLRTSP